MTSTPSLWARVAARYVSPTELRTAVLGARFVAAFDEGLLKIRKPNGVERRVDFDEFRATWRLLAANGSDEMLAIASGNVEYLRAIREDLILHGVEPDAELVISEDDVGTMERSLLEQAERHSRPAGHLIPDASVEPAGASGREHGASGDRATLDVRASFERELADLRRQLQVEREEKETALRDAARLAAALTTSEEMLAQEQRRIVALEHAATKQGEVPRRRTVIGIEPDPTELAIVSAERTLPEVSGPQMAMGKAVATAVDLARRDPASAITKCRVVLEALVRDEWCRVFGADGPPKWKSFHDLARELDGQPGVDRDILNAQRTLYRLANPGAHTLDGVSARRTAIVLLMTVNILAGRL